jgi:hypothetical protein
MADFTGVYRSGGEVDSLSRHARHRADELASLVAAADRRLDRLPAVAVLVGCVIERER